MSASEPDRTASARKARIDRQAQTSRDVGRIFDAHELAAVQVAADTGASPQHVSAWRDPGAEKNLSLADARAISSVPARRALMDLVGGADLVAVRRHASPHAAANVRNARALLASSLAAVDHVLKANGDGVIDPAELRQAIALLDALIVDAEGMRTALLAEQTPAPAPLRAVPGGGW